MHKKQNTFPHFLLWIILLVISSCNFPARQPSQSSAVSTRYAEWQQTLTPIQRETDASLADKTPVPPWETEPIVNGASIEDSLNVFIHPGVPGKIIEALRLPPFWEESNENDADIRILIGEKNREPQRPADSTWVYALTAPFYTIEDEITSTDLISLWQGNRSEALPFNRILLPAESHAVLQNLFGPPDDSFVEIADINELNSLALTNLPILSVVHFDALDPHWKVLKVDGQSPIDDNFSPDTYALSIDIWVDGDFEQVLIPGNYDPGKKTVLIMTGVTALTRATAYRMEIQGNPYPGRDILPWVSTADFVHINNEVPFAVNCPFPNPFQSDLIFCSSPDRIELLDYIGANIIEMSGNHLLDYGVPAMNLTLEMYADRGWETYAGGWDLVDSRAPALISHHNNQLAFIGCNPAGPPNSWATPSSPGTAPCGDYQWMVDEIRTLSSMGYLPIVTLQYIEDYTAYPSAQMAADFQRLAEAGAVVVSGSQAHTPKSMVFHEGSFLHYGLGNLFFDQMEVYYNGILMQGTREGFLDRLVFYDGQLISVELLTTMLEDYARPRPMTTAERTRLLSRIFAIAVTTYE
jgi:hypothetical protein